MSSYFENRQGIYRIMDATQVFLPKQHLLTWMLAQASEIEKNWTELKAAYKHFELAFL